MFGGFKMNVVLIAHEAKKKLMQNFCIAYRGILSHHDVYLKRDPKSDLL